MPKLIPQPPVDDRKQTQSNKSIAPIYGCTEPVLVLRQFIQFVQGLFLLQYFSFHDCFEDGRRDRYLCVRDSLEFGVDLVAVQGGEPGNEYMNGTLDDEITF